MIIRRDLQSGNYTRIPNEFLRDNAISDKARGTLARLLSRQDTWDLSVRHLVNTGKDGATAVRSALAELEGAGYLHRDVVRDNGGRIRGTRYLIFDNRVSPAEARAVISPPVAADTYCPNVGSRVSNVGSNVSSPPTEVHSQGLGNEVSNDAPNLRSGQAMEKEQVPAMAPARVIPPSMVKDNGSDIEKSDASPPAPSLEETYPQTDHRTRKTQMRETEPVITNKGINNPEGVTTTTPAQGAAQGGPDLNPSPSSFPATKQEINSLIELIPEHHRKPTVEKLVREALGHHEHHQVKEAVVYAADNVRGGWMQYRAYLDKTLQNGWAAGYLDGPADPAAAWMDTGTMVPAVLNQGRPRARFANGSVTGSHRMDDNYRAGVEFMMMMGVEV